MTLAPGSADHWDTVYAENGRGGVSWAQTRPAGSLAAVDALGLERDVSVIDVGGGASTFTAAMRQRGFDDLSVLDISRAALDLGRDVLDNGVDQVRWIQADLLAWTPESRYYLWHDRAVFHFLATEADRKRYRTVLCAALAEDGAVIVETFGPGGPDRCSGLRTRRYDAAALERAVGPGFTSVASGREAHVTPAGDVQYFTWLALRRAFRDRPPA